jgi:hypothetical protein
MKSSYGFELMAPNILNVMGIVLMVPHISRIEAINFCHCDEYQ